jgi:hypothetical protein
VEVARIAALLRELDQVTLSDCVVVGRYRRYDEQVRHKLKDWVDKIQHPLRQKINLFENFLIWAAPGSGKTYFVEQIKEDLRNTLSSDLDYVYCNLAKDNQNDFKEKVSGLPNLTRPVLCLIDEIDAKPDETWPYDVCFPQLGINQDDKQRRIVIVLIGSTHSGIDGLVSAMENRQKGKDLVNRVFAQNRFTIPATTLLDSAVVILGEVWDALGDRVKAVEKLALLYALCEPTLRNAPRQLTEFVRRAAKRLLAGEKRLRYHHAFDPGDWAQYDFCTKYHNLLSGLQDVDVKVLP